MINVKTVNLAKNKLKIEKLLTVKVRKKLFKIQIINQLRKSIFNQKPI